MLPALTACPMASSKENATLRGRAAAPPPGRKPGPSPWQTEEEEGWTRRNMLAESDDSMAFPTEMDEYLFDLKGYSVLRNAITPEDVSSPTRPRAAPPPPPPTHPTPPLPQRRLLPAARPAMRAPDGLMGDRRPSFKMLRRSRR